MQAFKINKNENMACNKTIFKHSWIYFISVDFYLQMFAKET